MSEDFRPSTRTLDRNKAILQARNLLEIPDWVIFSSQVTTFSLGDIESSECAPELVSVTIFSPDRKTLLDSFVRPSGAVTTDMLRQHGTDQATLMNSVTASSLMESVTKLCEKRDVLCWDLPLQVRNLGLVAARARQTAPFLRAVSIQSCYARFVGEELAPGSYKNQPLPGGSCDEEESVTPLKECENIVELIYMMAGSSQLSDSAQVMNKNWSSAFYKPKLGAAQKIRSFLGFSE